MPKLPPLRQISLGERSLRDFHQLLMKSSAGSGMGMMVASLCQLYWAALLIGFPWPAAALVAGSLEVLLAVILSTVTTIKRQKHDKKTDGFKATYYWSLWAIFAFLLTISIAGNVGHAVIFLSQKIESGALPKLLVDNAKVVYAVGGALAGMVAIGGSFGAHVSGFIRAHGAGSDWVSEDGTAPATPAAPQTPARHAKPSVQKPATVTDINNRDRAHAADKQPRRSVSAPIPEQPAAAQPTPTPEAPTAAAPDAAVPPVAPAITEGELYAEYAKARLDRQYERFAARGDLNGTQLGIRLGQTPGNGRKVKSRFESQFAAENPEFVARENVEALTNAG